jgi:hypothetical protein
MPLVNVAEGLAAPMITTEINAAIRPGYTAPGATSVEMRAAWK